MHICDLHLGGLLRGGVHLAYYLAYYENVLRECKVQGTNPNNTLASIPTRFIARCSRQANNGSAKAVQLHHAGV